MRRTQDEVDTALWDSLEPADTAFALRAHAPRPDSPLRQLLTIAFQRHCNGEQRAAEAATRRVSEQMVSVPLQSGGQCAIRMAIRMLMTREAADRPCGAGERKRAPHVAHVGGWVECVWCPVGVVRVWCFALTGAACNLTRRSLVCSEPARSGRAMRRAPTVCVVTRKRDVQ